MSFRKKLAIFLIIATIVIIIGHLTCLDYSDLSWSKNAGGYLGIISMLLLLISAIINWKKEVKKK